MRVNRHPYICKRPISVPQDFQNDNFYHCTKINVLQKCRMQMFELKDWQPNENNRQLHKEERSYPSRQANFDGN